MALCELDGDLDQVVAMGTEKRGQGQGWGVTCYLRNKDTIGEMGVTGV